MTTQIFLICPPDADAAFAAVLEQTLAAAPVSAVLIPRAAQAENAYKSLCKALVPVIQQAGAAALVEGDAGLVKLLKADGLHAPLPPKDLKAAVGALRPQFIVGAAAIEGRHDAMSKGELDVDYVFFGSLSSPIEDEMRETAQWWAETMEIPAVLSDPMADAQSADAGGCEFFAIGQGLWQAPEGPVAALVALTQALERT